MFLRQTRRKKDGKTHVYWNIVENRRLDDGRVVQRQVLYLGEIHSSQAAAWRKAIEVFDEASGEPRTLALFPEDRCAAIDEGSAVRVCLSALTLRRPRQWGACWLAGQLWRELQLDRFWTERLPPSRKGTRWDQILQVLVAYRLIAPGSEWEAASRLVRQQRHGRSPGSRFRPRRGPQAVRLSRPAAGAQERVVFPSGRALAGPVQRQL